MHIIPAIDLVNGQCVRLTEGDFERMTIYNNNPLQQAQLFQDQGAEWLHVVDLDGAKSGQSQQFSLIQSMTTQMPLLKIQAGGGIREASTLGKFFEAGLKRVVIGSMAIESMDKVKNLIKLFGAEKILLAFDIRLTKEDVPLIMTSGWQKNSHVSLWDTLNHYSEDNLDTIMCTDVARDGALLGTNVLLYKEIKRRFPNLNIVASGGVKDIHDLKALATLGLEGVIVGKAIYEGRIDLKTAITELRHAC